MESKTHHRITFNGVMTQLQHPTKSWMAMVGTATVVAATVVGLVCRYRLFHTSNSSSDSDSDTVISKKMKKEEESGRQHESSSSSWLLSWSPKMRLFSSSSSASAGGVRQPKFYYLDYNGTTPVYPTVLTAMIPYLTEHYGNPSSSHLLGREPKRAIDYARKQILHHLLGCSKDSEEDEYGFPLNLSMIWFTGCGTESDNLAIQLALQTTMGTHNIRRRRHIVTSNVEHPAVESYLKYIQHETKEVDVTYVPVNEEGRVSAQDVIDAMTDDTILVTLMTANNESGALQPVKEVGEACRRRGILFHTDAAQAAGKVSIHLEDLGHPDMVSIVGHKIGAPKGIAALYVRNGCLEEHGRHLPHNHGIMLIGGGQEFGRRGGTENTPYIVGLGMAAELAQQNLVKNATHMENLRSRLLKNLQDKLGDSMVRPNGPKDPSHRLPNTLSVGFDNVQSAALLGSIGHVVAASSGAACHGSGQSISSVLRAMNVPESFARGTVRLSLGPMTIAREVDEASEIIAQAIQSQLRGGATTS